MLEQLKVIDRGLLFLFQNLVLKRLFKRSSKIKMSTISLCSFINIRGLTEWCQKWDSNL